MIYLHREWGILTTITVIPNGGLCVAPMLNTNNIGCQSCTPFFEWRIFCQMTFSIGRKGWTRMQGQSIEWCPMSFANWRNSLPWTFNGANWLQIYNMWREERCINNVVWPLSMRLAHAMFITTNGDTSKR